MLDGQQAAQFHDMRLVGGASLRSGMDTGLRFLADELLFERHIARASQCVQVRPQIAVACLGQRFQP